MSTPAYTPIRIDIPTGSTIQDVLHRLNLPDAVVVNIYDGAGEATVFSPENLQEALKANPREIVCEVISEQAYKLLVGKSLTHLRDALTELQNRLLTAFVGELAQPVADVITRTKHLLTIVSCLALQKNQQKLLAHIKTTEQILEDISLACFYYDDNVRCYDGIRFALIPQLEEIGKII